MDPRRVGRASAVGVAAMVVYAGCGGGGSSPAGPGAGSDGGASSSGGSGASGSSSGGSGTSGSSSGGSGTSGSSSGGSGSSGADGGSSTAAGLAGKLGKPARLLVGLGGGGDVSAIKAQGITTDIHERYLVGVGNNLDGAGWPTWNSPPGDYVNVVAQDADSVSAVPMYTLYAMAARGDGNLAGLADPAFMTPYWDQAKLMFQRIAMTGKPALVHIEPDFWGYTEQKAGGDPTKVLVHVKVAADCADLPDDVSGMPACMMRLARKYAPKAYVGFSPSDWGAPTTAEVSTWMTKIGAGGADFVVMQTLDRDAGCFEAATEADCMRGGTGWYWDETNTKSPSFKDHLATAQAYHTALNLPLVWWQTPLGVPSATPGGTPNHYRDNRVHYFLTHPDELVAVGGLGVVFGTGAGNETDITTDSGQFKTLSTAYFAKPAPLP